MRGRYKKGAQFSSPAIGLNLLPMEKMILRRSFLKSGLVCAFYHAGLPATEAAAF